MTRKVKKSIKKSDGDVTYTVTHTRPDLVLIEWHDAETDAGWDKRTTGDIERKAIARSVGWLILENDHTLMLCGDTDKSGDSNRTLRIPRVCVESVTVVKKGKAR